MLLVIFFYLLLTKLTTATAIVHNGASNDDISWPCSSCGDYLRINTTCLENLTEELQKSCPAMSWFHLFQPKANVRRMKNFDTGDWISISTEIKTNFSDNCDSIYQWDFANQWHTINGNKCLELTNETVATLKFEKQAFLYLTQNGIFHCDLSIAHLEYMTDYESKMCSRELGLTTDEGRCKWHSCIDSQEENCFYNLKPTELSRESIMSPHFIVNITFDGSTYKLKNKRHTSGDSSVADTADNFMICIHNSTESKTSNTMLSIVTIKTQWISDIWEGLASYGFEMQCWPENSEDEPLQWRRFPYKLKYKMDDLDSNDIRFLRKIELVHNRIFPDSSIQFSLTWQCPWSWNGAPGRFDLLCVVLDRKYMQYHQDCYECFKLKPVKYKASNLNIGGGYGEYYGQEGYLHRQRGAQKHYVNMCNSCWYDVGLAEPMAVMTKQLEWTQTHVSLLYSTRQDQDTVAQDFHHRPNLISTSSQINNIQIIRLGNFERLLTQSSRAQADFASFMTRFISVPSTTPGISQLSHTEANELTSICKVKPQTDEAMAWSLPIVIDHSNTKLSVRMIVSIYIQDLALNYSGAIAAVAEYDEANDIYTSSSWKEFPLSQNIPAVQSNEWETVYIRERTQLIRTVGQNKFFSQKRLACFHPVYRSWFAFVEKGSSLEMSWYRDNVDGKVDIKFYEDIPWHPTRVISRFPLNIECSTIHPLVAWSERKGENKIIIHTATIASDEESKNLTIRISSSNFPLCPSITKEASGYFSFYYKDVNTPSSLALIVACGLQLCTRSIDAELNIKKGFSCVKPRWGSRIINMVSADNFGHIFWTYMNSSEINVVCVASPGSAADTDYCESFNDRTLNNLYLITGHVANPEQHPLAKDKKACRLDMKRHIDIGSTGHSKGFALLSFSVYNDPSSMPVIPFSCMYPEISDAIEMKTVSETTAKVQLESFLRESPNSTVPCSRIAKSKVIYRLHYKSLLPEDIACFTRECFDGHRLPLDNENFIVLPPKCRNKCYDCNKMGCSSSTFETKEFDYSGFKQHYIYFLQLSIDADISDQSKNLWYGGRKASGMTAIYKHHFVPPPSTSTVVLAIALPLLFIVFLLTGVTLWLFQKRKWLLTGLHRIAERDVNKIKKLGEGHFGEVWKADLLSCNKIRSQSESRTVVVKILKPSASDRDEKEFRDEALLLSKLKCEQIVKPLGICLQSRPIMLVMEFMNGGSLDEFLKMPESMEQLNVHDLYKIIQDVCKACAYLEQQGYIHRDIAARNCLVQLTATQSKLNFGGMGKPKITKLADFGLAKDVGVPSNTGAPGSITDHSLADQIHPNMDQTLSKNNQPTPAKGNKSKNSFAVYTDKGEKFLPIAWTAPEGFRGKFSTSSDIWAFGVLIWEVFSWCSQPFGKCSKPLHSHICPLKRLTLDEVEYMVCVKKEHLGNIQDPCGSLFTDSIKAVMAHCWANEPNARPAFKQLQRFLQNAKKEDEHTGVSNAAHHDTADDESRGVARASPQMISPAILQLMPSYAASDAISSNASDSEAIHLQPLYASTNAVSGIQLAPVQLEPVYGMMQNVCPTTGSDVTANSDPLNSVGQSSDAINLQPVYGAMPAVSTGSMENTKDPGLHDHSDELSSKYGALPENCEFKKNPAGIEEQEGSLKDEEQINTPDVTLEPVYGTSQPLGQRNLYE